MRMIQAATKISSSSQTGMVVPYSLVYAGLPISRNTQSYVRRSAPHFRIVSEKKGAFRMNLDRTPPSARLTSIRAVMAVVAIELVVGGE